MSLAALALAVNCVPLPVHHHHHHAKRVLPVTPLQSCVAPPSLPVEQDTGLYVNGVEIMAGDLDFIPVNGFKYRIIEQSQDCAVARPWTPFTPPGGNAGSVTAPEISVGEAGTALTLLAGFLIVITSGGRKS